MKKYFVLIPLLIALQAGSQQLNFKTDISTAKNAYAAGKLEEAHFALLQSLQEIDITIGKEVLKLLPETLGGMAKTAGDDNVTGNVSFVGATIHRGYGTGDKTATIEIVNNSPMLGTLNAFLNMPMMGGLMNDGKTKVLKVQGYKSRLTRDDTQDGKTPYRLEIPFNNALVTVNAAHSSESEMIAMANAIPLEKVAKLIQ